VSGTRQGGGGGEGGEGAGVAEESTSRAASASAAVMESWGRVRQQLAAGLQQLPPSLQGLFDDLLAVGTDSDAWAAAGVSDATAAARRVDELQSRLAAFLAAWEGEMATSSGDGGYGGEPSAAALSFTTAADGVKSYSWQKLGMDTKPPGGSPHDVAGLVDLVGEEEALRMMSAGEPGGEGGGGAADASPSSSARQRRGGGEEEFQPYEVMEAVHHDIHIQRYLAVS